MRYDLEINIEPKAPVQPLNLKIDVQVVREFKFVARQNGVSMTHVLTKMLKEFVSEHKNKGLPQQRSLF